MFTFKTHIRMHDTDAAGILYFPNQFQIAHEAFEAFLDSAGLPVRHMLDTADYLFPIVHAEGDYSAPVGVGDPLTINLTAERIGSSSVTLLFRLLKDGRETGLVRTVHVAVNKSDFKKRPLPPEMRAAVEKL